MKCKNSHWFVALFCINVDHKVFAANSAAAKWLLSFIRPEKQEIDPFDDDDESAVNVALLDRRDRDSASLVESV
ncbi:hypothetical protein T10_2362 [Trichinella papuae]|uniref:Uncharacterized protein n=1 Tax=Trichinella papuae TaxID=268474 RepID=A0A0V1MA09_9BILA|nr:hypothetical protein T10_2362 [Trichinella papuae]